MLVASLFGLGLFLGMIVTIIAIIYYCSPSESDQQEARRQRERERMRADRRE